MVYGCQVSGGKSVAIAVLDCGAAKPVLARVVAISHGLHHRKWSQSRKTGPTIVRRDTFSPIDEVVRKKGSPARCQPMGLDRFGLRVATEASLRSAAG
jgi:hypothetical protein